MKNTNYTLTRQGARGASNNMKVTGKVNAFGLAQAYGREDKAYHSNIGGTNEQGKKMQAGMDKLATKPKREHQD